jgi:hypothetical protein
MVQWKVAEGHYENDPIRIHFRDDVRPDDRYPICARITWHAAARDDAGMPVLQELEQMDEYTKILQAKVEESSFGLITMVLISDGECQWVLYVADVPRFEAMIQETLTATNQGVCPIEAKVDEDPLWEVHQQLFAGINKAPKPKDPP